MKRSVTPAVSPDLNGRVAVVGGAGAPGQGVGNGRAAALLLAAAGANVVAVDRVEADGATTASMIEADGGQAMAIIGDVTNADFCNHVLAATIERFGPPTVLVNNVGIGAAGSIVDTEPEIWDRVLRVNVNSVYQMSRTIVPAMAEAGGGAIVNTGSISSLRPTGNTAYATSKGAVNTLTTAMALDHAADAIRVNAVIPGPVWTPRMDRPDMTPERRERRRAASPLGIEGSGWDVAHLVLFLASDLARWITGQCMVVDGGVTLTSPAR